MPSLGFETRLQAMQALQTRCGGPGMVGGRRSPLPAAAAAAAPHPAAASVRCSAAGSVQEANTTSGSSEPASWPSSEARRAGYGSSPREPALRVPAEVTGRLPQWLRGQYIRNGPGDLREMEVSAACAVLWWRLLRGVC